MTYDSGYEAGASYSGTDQSAGRTRELKTRHIITYMTFQRLKLIILIINMNP